MNAQSNLFEDLTSQDTPSAISSPALGAGLLRSGRPESQTISLSGQEAALAKVSRTRGSKKASKTNATYGRILLDSSVNVDQIPSWVNRSLQHSLTNGSMEYSMTLKLKATPRGRLIYRLAASAHRTSDHASGGSVSGYPTPRASEAGADFAKAERSDTGMALPAVVALMAGYPTPTAHDDNKSPEAHLAMKKRMGERDGTNSNRTEITSLQVLTKAMAGWASPQAHDSGMGNSARVGRYGTEHGGRNLNDEAALVAGWASPSSRDYKDTPGMATEGINPDGSLRDRTDQLPRQAVMVSGWQPPATDSFRSRGGDRKDEMGLDQEARCLAGWPTARAEDGESCGNHPGAMDSLKGVARAIVGWPAVMAEPKGSDTMMRGNLTLQGAARQSAHGETTSSSAPTPNGSTGAWASKGALNPAFVRWLMGYPPEHLEAAPGKLLRVGQHQTPASRKTAKARKPGSKGAKISGGVVITGTAAELPLP